MSLSIRQTKIVDVGDKSYTLTQLPATKAYKYYKKLASEGLDSLNEEEIKSLIIESTQMLPATYEIEFSGKLMSLITLTGNIIEFNFADVFQVPDLEEEK